MTTSAYLELERRWARLHRLDHLRAIAGWDRAAMMPAKGSEARAQALAEIESLLHRLRTEPDLATLLARAEDESLDDAQRANLREIRRDWKSSNALPEALVEAKSLATSRCEHAWQTQRPAGDWPGFLANFRDVLRLSREEAQRRADDSGLAPYDALMDQFEPGMTSAEVDAVFGDLQRWLPGLVRAVLDRQANESLVPPRGPFPKAAQRALSLEVMRLLGFDFEAGRLDESAHPFSGGVPEDTRLTTRYREDDFVQSLMGTIHETGHARYEQNLPRERLGQPVARARSMAIHESQSLSFEMQLARSAAFVARLAPLVAAQLGAQEAFQAGNLHRLLTRVRPGLIRVDADELTYPAHVILRYGIERRLIEGEIEADDIPALWDEGMARLLGIDTRGDFANGCLQDVHWSAGLFGYFPCYTLGAMYAAQWFAAIRRTVGDLDARIGAGDLEPVFAWLRANIWQAASRWPTGELAVRASGAKLESGPLPPPSRGALPRHRDRLTQRERGAEAPRDRQARQLAPPSFWPSVQADLAARRRGARLAAVALAPVFFAALRAVAFERPATWALSASMRSISACMSREDGTPSFFIALAVRSSKIVSSLSQCLPAFDDISSAMLVMRLLTSPSFSSATLCVRFCSEAPSLTSASKTCLPSACALAKAPIPASQICCADSFTELARALSNRPAPAALFFLSAIALSFLTMCFSIGL